MSHRREGAQNCSEALGGCRCHDVDRRTRVDKNADCRAGSHENLYVGAERSVGVEQRVHGHTDPQLRCQHEDGQRDCHAEREETQSLSSLPCMYHSVFWRQSTTPSNPWLLFLRYTLVSSGKIPQWKVFRQFDETLAQGCTRAGLQDNHGLRRYERALQEQE